MITNFIQSKNIKGKSEKDISAITGFGQAVWILISSIYESDWDNLNARNQSIFC